MMQLVVGNSFASAVKVRPKPQLSALNSGRQEEEAIGEAQPWGTAAHLGKTHISAAGLGIQLALSLGQSWA